jgi:hypothetical protein
MDKINVDLSHTPEGYIAEAGVLPVSDVVLHAVSNESYVEAIANLRRAIAYEGETGTIDLTFWISWFDDKQEQDEAFALHADELTITPEYVERVRREVAGR